MNAQIDRKTAAKLLKVSVRTVDRYIAQEKIKAVKVEGRISLNRREIMNLKRKNRVDNEGSLYEHAESKMSIDKIASVPVDMSIDSVDSLSTSKKRNIAHSKLRRDDSVYKKLFEELQLELKQKQERLEGANYRVGQLEALIKESVPLLEHRKMLIAAENKKIELSNQTEVQKKKLRKLIKLYKDEKLNKRVYLVILFIIMMLQPLWFILLMKQ